MFTESKTGFANALVTSIERVRIITDGENTPQSIFIHVKALDGSTPGDAQHDLAIHLRPAEFRELVGYVPFLQLAVEATK